MSQSESQGHARPRSRQLTEERVLDAGRRLFAAHGLQGISVREIARAAGVDHALVHRYFGGKADLVAAIIRRDVAAMVGAGAPEAAVPTTDALDMLRSLLWVGLEDRRDVSLLIMRAELNGLAPETFIKEPSGHPVSVLAEWIRSRREAIGRGNDPLPDPALVGAVLIAAVFGLIGFAPWLLTAAGLRPEDAERRRDELVDILIQIVAQVGGVL